MRELIVLKYALTERVFGRVMLLHSRLFRATDTGNMHKKTGEYRTCSPEGHTDRQTDRQTRSSQYLAQSPIHGRVVAEYRRAQPHQLQHPLCPQDPDDHLSRHRAARRHGDDVLFVVMVTACCWSSWRRRAAGLHGDDVLLVVMVTTCCLLSW